MASIPTTSPQHSLERDCQWLDDFRNDVARGTTVFSDNTVFKLCLLAGETRTTVKIVNVDVKPGHPYSFGLSIENLYALIDRATAHLIAKGAPKSFYEDDDAFLARMVKHKDSDATAYTGTSLLRLHRLAGEALNNSLFHAININGSAGLHSSEDTYIDALIRRALARNSAGDQGSDGGPDVPDGPVEDGFAPGFEERCGKSPEYYAKRQYVIDIPDDNLFVDRLERILNKGFHLSMPEFKRLAKLAGVDVDSLTLSNETPSAEDIDDMFRFARENIAKRNKTQQFLGRAVRNPNNTDDVTFLRNAVEQLKAGIGLNTDGFTRLGDIAQRLGLGDYDTLTPLDSNELLSFVAKLQELAFIEMPKKDVITSDDTAAQFLDRMRRAVNAHKVVFKPADIERLEALAGIPAEFRNSKGTGADILANVRALIASAEERLGLLRIVPENPPPPVGRPDTGPQGAVGRVGPPTTSYRLVHTRGMDTIVHNVVSERFLREVLELTLADGSRRLFPLYHFRDVHTNWKGTAT